MDKVTDVWKRRVPQAVRKPLVFIIGFAVVATGIALLVLPGPGWAAIFLGFAILATEFAFAEKVRDWLVEGLKRGIQWAKDTYRRLVSKLRKKPKA